MAEKSVERQFVLCIKSDDCEDIERRKVYQVIPDEEAAKGYIRVIDESGEDYLYPDPICSSSTAPRRRTAIVTAGRTIYWHF